MSNPSTMMPQVQQIDEMRYIQTVGGIALQKHRMDNEYFTTINPQEQQNLVNSTFPTQLNFNIPPQDFILTTRSFYIYNIKVTLPAPSSGTLTYYISNNNIYSYDGTNTVKIANTLLPFSARQILKDVQITKDNRNGSPSLDVTQYSVFRDNEFVKLLSQGFINSQSNTYFMNNDQHTIAVKNVGDSSDTFLFLKVPFSQVHSMFNILPEFPMALLNNPLKLCINQQNPYPSTVTEWYGFQLQLCMMRNTKLYEKTRKEKCHYTYQQYDRSIKQMQMQDDGKIYITGAYKSLDMIQLNMVSYKTDLYNNGFSLYSTSDDKLFGDAYATANKKTKVSFGDLQILVNSQPLFTKQLTRLDDLYQLIMQDGNLNDDYSNYLNVASRSDEFLYYFNHVLIKLDDMLDETIQSGSANFTGIQIVSDSNAEIDFTVGSYSSNLRNYLRSTATDNINIELTLYYSTMLTLDGGDLFVSITK